MEEARFYKKEPVGKTRCLLCPQRCFLANNKVGRCLARVNKDGILYTKIYGQVSSYAMDPIEKKPLYHFYPGSLIFSIGSYGCNFKCTFCQNWHISQQEVSTEKFSPEDIVEIAISNKSTGVAYTYNEPFIWFEFVYDTAKIAKEKGLKNVLVTNGFVNEEPLRELLPYIDAMNIDLKASNESFYREICDGQLAPVMRTIQISYSEGVHIELTNLIIPTLNDRVEEINEIVEWIVSVSPDIPIHFTRYFPQYKMDIEPTPIETLITACEIAKNKLKYVYMGNTDPKYGGADTICPKCKKVLISRSGYYAKVEGLKDNKCIHCGEPIYGRF
jgi:pyruvate formate lyase activating enzyme